MLFTLIKKISRILYYLIPSFIRKPLNSYLNYRYQKKIQIGPKDFNKVIHNPEDSNSLIKQKLLDNKPMLVARVGGTEAKCTFFYLNNRKNKKNPKPYPIGLKEEALYLSGIFPMEDNLLDNFCELFLDLVKDTDVMAVWFNAGENTVCNDYCPDADLIHLDSLEPFWFENPWTEALEEKKVLVISPFEETIKSQYQKRDLLFKNPKILPEFDLVFYKAVQGLCGNDDFPNWIEAFNFMCREIENIDFDIALVSAGAFGLPLASFIKSKRKKAIHIGGVAQILFGIKGIRWDLRPKYSEGLYNEHWVYLPEETKPKSPDKMIQYEGNLLYW